MTPAAWATFPWLTAVAPEHRPQIQTRLARWSNSFIATTADPVVIRGEIYAGLRNHGLDLPVRWESCGALRWNEGTVLITQIGRTWTLHAERPEDLVPWLRVFGVRKPPKPIQFPSFSAERASGAEFSSEGTAFTDEISGAQATLCVNSEGANILYDLPGGTLNQALEKRGRVGLYHPWLSAFREVRHRCDFAIVGTEGRENFLHWLNEQKPSQSLVDAVLEAMDVAHGVRRFDRRAICGPVLCHAEFYKAEGTPEILDSPLQCAGTPWLPPGEPARLLVGYWDIGTSDVFIYLGEDRRIYSYNVDWNQWDRVAGTYATYLERILRFDPVHGETLRTGQSLPELCSSLELTIDPVGSDDLGTLAVSHDVVAFQRPGGPTRVKCFTEEAKTRVAALLI